MWAGVQGTRSRPPTRLCPRPPAAGPLLLSGPQAPHVKGEASDFLTGVVVSGCTVIENHFSYFKSIFIK